MKDTQRRIILFIAIVGIGSALVFLNIPLVYMLLLIVAVGFVLLLVLGTITIREIKDAVSALSLSRLRRRSGKAGSPRKPEKKPAAAPAAGGKKPENAVPKKAAGPFRGFKEHLSLLGSSIGSLGKILTDRSKPKPKVEEIDKLLEHTISEKVTRSSALENAAAVPAAPGGAAGPGGAPPAAGGKEADPFLSLSGEELETGLLDGLDDSDLSASSPLSPATQQAPPAADTGLSMPDLEMPPLPEETAEDASAILAAHAGEESPATGGVDNGGLSLDESLGDLDSINLDEIDLGDDSDLVETPAEAAPVQPAGPPPGSGSLVPATPITAAADKDEDHSEMSAFAAGFATGSDDDMLSSLATDIKAVKKEKDISLLRELKDFKAPATDIEKELSEISEQLNSAANKGAKKRPSSVQGTK